MPPDYQENKAEFSNAVALLTAQLGMYQTDALAAINAREQDFNGQIDKFGMQGTQMDNQAQGAMESIAMIEDVLSDADKTVQDMAVGVTELARDSDVMVKNVKDQADYSSDGLEKTRDEAKQAMETDGDYWKRVMENGEKELEKWLDDTIEHVEGTQETAEEEGVEAGEDLKKNTKEMLMDVKRDTGRMQASEVELGKDIEASADSIPKKVEEVEDSIESNVVDHAEKELAAAEKKYTKSTADLQKTEEKRLQTFAEAGVDGVADSEKNGLDVFAKESKNTVTAEKGLEKGNSALINKLIAEANHIVADIQATSLEADSAADTQKMLKDQIKTAHKAELGEISVNEEQFEQELADNSAQLIPLVKQVKEANEGKIDQFEEQTAENTKTDMHELKRQVEEQLAKTETMLSDVQSKASMDVDQMSSNMKEAKRELGPAREETKEGTNAVDEVSAEKELAEGKLNQATSEMSASLGKLQKKAEQEIKKDMDVATRNMQSASGIVGTQGISSTIGVQLIDERQEALNQLKDTETKMKEEVEGSNRDWKKQLEELRLQTDEAVKMGSEGGANSLFNQIAELANVDAPNVAQQAVTASEKIHQELHDLSAEVPTLFSQTGDQLSREGKSVKGELKSDFESLGDDIEKRLDKGTISAGEQLKLIQGRIKQVSQKSDAIAAELKMKIERLRAKLIEIGNVIATAEPIHKEQDEMWAEASKVLGEGARMNKKAEWSRAVDSMGRSVDSKLMEMIGNAKKTVGKLLDASLLDYEQTEADAAATVRGMMQQNLNLVVGDAAHAEHITENLKKTGQTYKHEAAEVSQMLNEYEKGTSNLAHRLEAAKDTAIRDSKQHLGELEAEQEDSIYKTENKLKSDLDAIRARSSQGLEAVNLEVQKATGHMLRDLQHSDKMLGKEIENVTNAAQYVSDSAQHQIGMDETALENGAKHFEDVDSDLEAHVKLVDRQVSSKAMDHSAADGQAKKYDNMNERTEVGMNSLGEETDSVSTKAADELAILGNKAETSAKMSQVEIESVVNAANTKEGMAMQQQEARTAALENAVGALFEKIDELNRKANNARNMTLEDMALTKKLVVAESEEVDKATNYLKGYMGQSAFKVLEMLGHSVKFLVEQAHEIEQKFVDIDAGIYSSEAALEAIMGGAAMQQLLKLSRADDMALNVLVEDDKLKSWMIDWEKEAGPWRNSVEQAFSDLGVEMETTHAEIQAEQDEARAREEALAKGMEGQMDGLVNGVEGGGNDAQSIGKDLEANMDTMLSAQSAIDAADHARIAAMEAKAGKFPAAGEQAVAAGKAQLAAIRAQTASDAGTQAHIQETLTNLVKGMDESLANDRKRLQDQAINLQQQLTLGFTVGEKTADDAGAQSKTAADAGSLSEKQKKVQTLLDEAKTLTAEHARLEAKHQSTGQVIHSLINQVLGHLKSL